MNEQIKCLINMDFINDNINLLNYNSTFNNIQ
jgi:hypothetical protein